MGVKELWKLLAGCERQMQREELQGKVVAVDASIWIQQAVRGVRAKQHQVNTGYGRNGELDATHLGVVYRRLIRLMEIGAKLVFVFDGRAPAVKEKVLERRRRRKLLGLAYARQAISKMRAANDAVGLSKLPSPENSLEQEEVLSEDSNGSAMESDDASVGSFGDDVAAVEADQVTQLPYKTQRKVIHKVYEGVVEDRLMRSEEILASTTERTAPKDFSSAQLTHFLQHTALRMKATSLRETVGNEFKRSLVDNNDALDNADGVDPVNLRRIRGEENRYYYLGPKTSRDAASNLPAAQKFLPVRPKPQETVVAAGATNSKDDGGDAGDDDANDPEVARAILLSLQVAAEAKDAARATARARREQQQQQRAAYGPTSSTADAATGNSPSARNPGGTDSPAASTGASPAPGRSREDVPFISESVAQTARKFEADLQKALGASLVSVGKVKKNISTQERIVIAQCSSTGNVGSSGTADHPPSVATLLTTPVPIIKRKIEVVRDGEDAVILPEPRPKRVRLADECNPYADPPDLPVDVLECAFEGDGTKRTLLGAAGLTEKETTPDQSASRDEANTGGDDESDAVGGGLCAAGDGGDEPVYGADVLEAGFFAEEDGGAGGVDVDMGSGGFFVEGDEAGADTDAGVRVAGAENVLISVADESEDVDDADAMLMGGGFFADGEGAGEATDEDSAEIDTDTRVRRHRDKSCRDGEAGARAEVREGAALGAAPGANVADIELARQVSLAGDAVGHGLAAARVPVLTPALSAIPAATHAVGESKAGNGGDDDDDDDDDDWASVEGWGGDDGVQDAEVEAQRTIDDEPLQPAAQPTGHTAVLVGSAGGVEEIVTEETSPHVAPTMQAAPASAGRAEAEDGGCARGTHTDAAPTVVAPPATPAPLRWSNCDVTADDDDGMDPGNGAMVRAFNTPAPSRVAEEGDHDVAGASMGGAFFTPAAQRIGGGAVHNDGTSPDGGGGGTSPRSCGSAGSDGMKYLTLQQAMELQQKRLDIIRQTGANAADDMVQEMQHLLDVFGIPYMTSPTEADSQLGYLSATGLVDYIATEDSDVLLFGAKAVVRGLCGSRRSAQTTVVTDEAIKERLGFERKHLIALAMLVGADYTEGLRNVGMNAAQHLFLAAHQCIPSGVHGDEAFVEEMLQGVLRVMETTQSKQAEVAAAKADRKRARLDAAEARLKAAASAAGAAAGVEADPQATPEPDTAVPMTPTPAGAAAAETPGSRTIVPMCIDVDADVEGDGDGVGSAGVAAAPAEVSPPGNTEASQPSKAGKESENTPPKGADKKEKEFPFLVDRVCQHTLKVFETRRTLQPMDPFFPNENVLAAYTRPVVDTDGTAFEWGTPMWENLVDFGVNKVGMDPQDVQKTIHDLRFRFQFNSYPSVRPMNLFHKPKRTPLEQVTKSFLSLVQDTATFADRAILERYTTLKPHMTSTAKVDVREKDDTPTLLAVLRAIDGQRKEAALRKACGDQPRAAAAGGVAAAVGVSLESTRRGAALRAPVRAPTVAANDEDDNGGFFDFE